MNNILKIIYFDVIKHKNSKMHNPSWPNISDYHWWKTFLIIMGGPRTGRKKKALLTLKRHQPDI